MAMQLKSRLSLSYVMVVLLCIILITVLTNYFFDLHFREYVKENQAETHQNIVTQLSRQYQEDGWNVSGVETVGLSALENGLILRVKDASGTMLWDAAIHNHGMCQRIIEQMASNVSSRYPYVNATFTEVPYTVYNNLVAVGVVEIGSYGPYYMDEHDLAFINTLNRVVLGVGIFSLLLAFIIGHLIARHLSSPISKVIRSAKAIEHGDFHTRITDKSKTKEIIELMATINNLAETLEKEELLRKRLTGDVAHELRTPLATLQSHLEAMIDGVWEPNEARLKSCHDEIVRISKMVGDLEKLAKYEGEALILNKVYFNVTELLHKVSQNFEMEYRQKDITLDVDTTKEQVYGDPDKVSQVLINLLSNALKYTASGGHVSVQVQGNQKMTQITVQDTGQGISESDLPYIFERFYRADPSRNRLTGGSGIGLTITKAIVEAHNGTIEAYSQIHVGTTIIVNLPNKE